MFKNIALGVTTLASTVSVITSSVLINKISGNKKINNILDHDKYESWLSKFMPLREYRNNESARVVGSMTFTDYINDICSSYQNIKQVAKKYHWTSCENNFNEIYGMALLDIEKLKGTYDS